MLNEENLAIREVRMLVSKGKICERRGGEVGDAELNSRWDIVKFIKSKEQDGESN